jgi:vanillate O-demethylase monooxygenase subunit
VTVSTGNYPFSGDRVFVRNAWYVAAWSHEVDRSLLARTLLSEPVVLYRTAEGRPVALDGNCAHRQFPLVEGQLIGDEVECAYHGFRFGPDGRCTLIPSQDRVPSRCRVRSYPVAERWRWVWIWMGDPELADERLIPDHDEIGLSDAWATAPGTRLDVACRYQLLNENLLDLTHISFLHAPPSGPDPRSHATAREEILDDERGRFQRSRRVMEVASVRGTTLHETHDGPLELELNIDFWPPVFHVGSQSYRTPASADGPQQYLGTMRFFHCLTPCTEHSTHYFFALSRDFELDDEERTNIIRDRHIAVIEQDQVALAKVEPQVDRPNRPPDFSCGADAGALRGRRRVQALLDLEG